MKAKALSTLTNEATGEQTTVESVLSIQNVNMSFDIQYQDITDEKEPKQGSFRDSVNLPFGQEAELNRILTEKPYLLKVVPQLVSRISKGYDPQNSAAKEFKEAIQAALVATK